MKNKFQFGVLVNTRFLNIYAWYINTMILEPYPWYHSFPKRFLCCCCSGRDSRTLPSRCMQPALRWAPSSKLPPLYIPVSPVARAARWKPCPAALVPTLAWSRRPARNLDLLRSALSRHIMTESVFILKSKRSLHFSDMSSYPKRKEAPAHPDAFACASTSVRPRSVRAPVSPCLHPRPRTHGEIRGRSGPGQRAPETHTNRNG